MEALIIIVCLKRQISMNCRNLSADVPTFIDEELLHKRERCLYVVCEVLFSSFA